MFRRRCGMARSYMQIYMFREKKEHIKFYLRTFHTKNMIHFIRIVIWIHIVSLITDISSSFKMFVDVLHLKVHFRCLRTKRKMDMIRLNGQLTYHTRMETSGCLAFLIMDTHNY